MKRTKSRLVKVLLGLVISVVPQSVIAAGVEFHSVVASHQSGNNIPYLEVFTFADQVAVRYPARNNSNAPKTIFLEVNDKFGTPLPARISPSEFKLAPGEMGQFFIVLDMQDQSSREFLVCHRTGPKPARKHCIGYISSRVH
ncbi:MAG: hypothetical protein ACR2O3_16495 [Rhizobiaceae bacterium]